MISGHHHAKLYEGAELALLRRGFSCFEIQARYFHGLLAAIASRAWNISSAVYFAPG
jgi:hypothetical protein